jgi:hypothetical protein
VRKNCRSRRCRAAAPGGRHRGVLPARHCARFSRSIRPWSRRPRSQPRAPSSAGDAPHSLERPLLAPGIESDGHRCARPECREQKIVGIRAGVRAATAVGSSATGRWLPTTTSCAHPRALP